ncbi:MAG: hypothetical protein ACKV2V_27190 [Blastocatellia bacterium]
MTDGSPISALQSALNQSREARRKMEQRIVELESELKSLSAQLGSISNVIEQTEAALRRALFPGDPHAGSWQPTPPPPPAYDLEISSPSRHQQQHYQNQHQPLYPQHQQTHQQTHQQPHQPPHQQHYQQDNRYAQPPWQQHGYQPPPEPMNSIPDVALQYQTEQLEQQVAEVRRNEKNTRVRFNDFRIPQAATIVLREAGHALHVNDIYERMSDGGFEFRGQHQLITLAVSLSRSKRFRKVSPGTFELSPEYLAGQVA